MELSELIKLSYEYVWLIPLLPLIAFLIIILDRFSNRFLYRDLLAKNGYIASLVVGATLIGFVQSLLIFIGSLDKGNLFIEHNIKWLTAGNLTLSFGWMIDNLSIVMLLVVTSVSMLIQAYTHGYMEKDIGYRRFYAYLALFNFSMLGLVLSTNLFQIYIFWELVGLCSYLLIGFWFERPSAAKAAKKAFIMNRIGDCLFLIGILSFFYFSYTYWTTNDYTVLSFNKALLVGAAKSVFISAGPVVLSLIIVCIFFGAVAKSAQFPLHTWLPDAMEGPTPISALIHAATMVAAGVYLVARIYPVLEMSKSAMFFVTWIGVATVVITATIALTQTDIKRVLAYSTCSQLGYMITAMGIGACSAGMFHLCTHAYFKAMLFLCSGAVIHGLSGQQDMRFMGGLRKYMPITAWTYLIGALSISGILFSGFWSKDMILGKSFENITEYGAIDYNSLLVFIFLFISAGLTVFYMFRSYFMTFEGIYKGHSHPHESPNIMTYPLIILAIPSIFLGFAVSGLFGMPSFTEYLGGEVHVEPDWFIMILSFVVALAGLFAAIVFYWDKYKSRDPECIVKKFGFCYRVSYNKWYFDELYTFIVDKIFMLVSRLCALFDKFIIDGIVNLIAQITKACGYIIRLIQNGKVQFSTLVMYTGFVIITVIIVVCSLI